MFILERDSLAAESDTHSNLDPWARTARAYLRDILMGFNGAYANVRTQLLLQLIRHIKRE